MNSNKQIVLALIVGVIMGIGMGVDLEQNNPKYKQVQENTQAKETPKPLTISELSEKQKEKVTFRNVSLTKLLDFTLHNNIGDWDRIYIYKIDDINTFNSLSDDALAEFAQKHEGVGSGESKKLLFYIDTPKLDNIQRYKWAINDGFMSIPTAMGALPYKKFTSFSVQQTICERDIDMPYSYRRAYWRTMYNDWMWRPSDDVASSCTSVIKLD